MTEDDILLPESALTFDYPHYRWRGAAFVPRIFDAGPSESVPNGFNAVRVCLDGTMRSDLNWQAQMASARDYVSRGLKILWDLDLGLFSRLSLPLYDHSQLQALHLSLKHFCDVLWPVFAEVTLGIVVYRGSADFSRLFPWDAEQRDALNHFLHEHPYSNGEELTRLYCRNSCAQYLSRLTGGLPGNLQPCLLLDASGYSSQRHLLQVLHRECWDRFFMAVRGSIAPITALAWDGDDSALGYIGRRDVVLPVLHRPKVGLCLPTMETVDAAVDRAIDAALQSLNEGGEPYRVIAEEFLTADWDGLDELVVVEASVGPLLKRKLQGFSAAGGVVRLA